MKVKLQTAAGDALEVEVPGDMSPDELKTWISTVREALAQKPASKKSKK